LKRADIAVAMDDFGTGFSNLASLQSLPLDVLKMDRSFVTDMLIDTDKLAIIRAILSLAQTLGMKTTAEGIEDADAAAALRDMGCTYGQGYYFAKPLSADDAYEFWRSRSNLAT
jgi:cyclic di-GMP phosphodiesterase Gmr